MIINNIKEDNVGAEELGQPAQKQRVEVGFRFSFGAPT